MMYYEGPTETVSLVRRTPIDISKVISMSFDEFKDAISDNSWICEDDKQRRAE